MISKSSKPMVVNPLKVSQTMGAVLAFLGLNRSMPLIHANQGCSAYGKILFIRHFFEPVPIQTTALDHLAAVMDPDQQLIDALVNVCHKNEPEVIGVLTAGVSEAQGADVKRVINSFKEQYPQYRSTELIPVNVPDFEGCLESGFAKATESMINHFVPETTPYNSNSDDLVVLPGSMLTPADIEAIRRMVEAFGLNPIFIPDISQSLNGHLADERYRSITYGGFDVADANRIANACGCISIGLSMVQAANLLQERTGMPLYSFEGLTGLASNDRFINVLMTLSGKPVPEWLKRQRACLRDAYLDAHFYLGQCRAAVAADPDLLFSFSAIASEVGIDLKYAVTTHMVEDLEELTFRQVVIGDLSDFESLSFEHPIDLVIGNSYLAKYCDEQSLPLYRAGYPIFDRMGASRVCRVGYAGSTDLTIELANLVWQNREQGVSPYESILKPMESACGSASTTYAPH
mgnify:CR=1 FL=1